MKRNLSGGFSRILVWAALVDLCFCCFFVGRPADLGITGAPLLFWPITLFLGVMTGSLLLVWLDRKSGESLLFSQLYKTQAGSVNTPAMPQSVQDYRAVHTLLPVFTHRWASLDNEIRDSPWTAEETQPDQRASAPCVIEIKMPLILLRRERAAPETGCLPQSIPRGSILDQQISETKSKRIAQVAGERSAFCQSLRSPSRTDETDFCSPDEEWAQRWIRAMRCLKDGNVVLGEMRRMAAPRQVNWVKHYRKSRKVTQVELAKQVGISAGALCCIEAGYSLYFKSFDQAAQVLSRIASLLCEDVFNLFSDPYLIQQAVLLETPFELLEKRLSIQPKNPDVFWGYEETDDLFEVASQHSLNETIERLLSYLPVREERILRWRYGWRSEYPLSLEQVGKRMHLRREAVRLIEVQAISHLRQPGIRRDLAQYL